MIVINPFESVGTVTIIVAFSPTLISLTEITTLGVTGLTINELALLPA